MRARRRGDALDLIGEVAQHHAELIVIPVERFSEDFFQLRTGTAGAVLQKLVNHLPRLVVLGDVSRYVEQSEAFASFVRESNRGRQVWFLTSLDELNERLTAR